MHVGIVHGVSGIHFVAAADSHAALVREVAGYVKRQADVQLYARDAALVMDLLERDDDAGAVRVYFEKVGERWDREWLTSDVVPVARGWSGGGNVIPLFEGRLTGNFVVSKR